MRHYSRIITRMRETMLHSMENNVMGIVQGETDFECGLELVGFCS
jgi:hypothetical protein